MASPFVHLHTHSHYSLLQALPKIPELVNAAARDNMSALALTDNGNLYGTIEFYKECKKEGLRPIIGIDAYVATRTRRDREAKVDSKCYRLVLLAENEKGYKNLLELVTRSYLEGFYYKPRVDKELLQKYASGLIAILPSFSSEVADALRKNDKKRAEEIISWYQNTFGKNSLFLEITHHPEVKEHQALMKKIISFAEEVEVPLVAAHDVYYIKPEDRLAQETMARIQTGGGGEERGFPEGEKDFSFITQAQANIFFKDYPTAIENTASIADRCKVELELGSWVFPDLHLPDDTTYDKELYRNTYEGIAWRKLKRNKELTDRIEYEFKIIKEKGYSPYFLVVADLLKYARENNILTTTRGSAAGSIVSYLNGITNVNPITYKLPFERFLNPERPSPPDIDMDIADDRRDEVIQYTKNKYGEDRVAQIGTFGTMMARAAVRDIARALGHPYATGDRIAKLIPFGAQGFPMYIDRAMEMITELSDLYKKDRDAKEIIDLAKKIEGSARHISVHAAGVVISPTPLTDFVPLQLDPKGGKIITQYDMYSVEDAGLLKFDFLGIKNLSILSDSVKRVKEEHGIKIDIENVPIDDKKTYKMLASGETMGLFQLSGGGMTRFLKDLKPTTIHDINAMIALYRPGPMSVIPEYIERKHDPKLIRYLDPRMEKYLKESYGLIVYQDDLLLSAIELAGYSWLEADKFRKAVGKKIPAEMAAQKERFIKGVVENGQSKEFAEKVWRLFEPFQGYGFNKAHAASYGKVAYQTAYMKANYPAPYMAALLTADAGDTDKVAEAIAECSRLGIPVLPPDVNESAGDFTIVENIKGDTAIRFGLYSIKNFGEGMADAIIAQRNEEGRFTDWADFMERLSGFNMNRKALESLIKCGALDSLGERGAALLNIETLLTHGREFAKTPENQDSLFGDLPSTSTPSLSLEKSEPVSLKEKLAWEKELLGVYVSGHPLDEYREKLANQKTDIRRLQENLREGMSTVFGGLIEDTREILTKSGEKMAFLRLVDLSGSIEAVAFPRVLAEYQSLLAKDKCIALKGRYSLRNNEPSIIIEAVKAL